MKGRYRKRLSQILGTPSIEHTTNPAPFLIRQHVGSRTGSKLQRNPVSGMEGMVWGDGSYRVGGEMALG